MNSSFLSLVTIVNHPDDIQKVANGMAGLFDVLQTNFSDFELILINNTKDRSIEAQIEQMPPLVKKEIYLTHLSRPVDRNNALVAGMDQANGDYIVYFEPDFFSQPQLIIALYEKTQENHDIVYLRSTQKTKGWLRNLVLKIFFWILHRYAQLEIDAYALESRIISRRALNSILKLRENLRYMQAIYSLVGYRTAYVTITTAIEINHDSLSDEISMYINAITSFTDFLRVLLRWIFIVSMILFAGTTINAILVKLVGFDIFGHPQQEVTGWAFLVILTSLTFSILCLILYIMSIYLGNIYREIKQRPLYIVESSKRF